MSFTTSKRVRTFRAQGKEDTGNGVTEFGYRQDHSGPGGHAHEFRLFSKCDRKSSVGLAQETRSDEHVLKNHSGCYVKN